MNTQTTTMKKAYRKLLLDELLQDIELLRPSRANFVQGVKNHYHKYKIITPKQYNVLKAIQSELSEILQSELNKKYTIEAWQVITEKFPVVCNINKN
jgi:hypothetical protein